MKKGQEKSPAGDNELTKLSCTLADLSAHALDEEPSQTAGMDGIQKDVIMRAVGIPSLCATLTLGYCNLH